MKKRSFILLFTILCMLFVQVAEAARIGSGRSSGMQRSTSNYGGYRNNGYSNANRTGNNYGNANNGSQGTGIANNNGKAGMGAGTAGLIGAAAGATGGYLLGKSMANNNDTNNQNNLKSNASGVNQNVTSNEPQQLINQAQNLNAESKFPWGIIAILVALLVFGLMFFRKKSIFGTQGGNNNFFGSTNNNDNANISNTNNGYNNQNTPNSNQQQFNQQNNFTTPANNNPSNPNVMLDGIEVIYFLRQAKGMFLHIQSMNNAINVEEVAKYLTPELYNEIKQDIMTNNSIADFVNLNCRLLNNEIINNNQLVASVEFNGMVSEDAGQPQNNFMEIWNFIKPDMAVNRWLVSGIQQAAATV